MNVNLTVRGQKMERQQWEVGGLAWRMVGKEPGWMCLNSVGDPKQSAHSVSPPSVSTSHSFIAVFFYSYPHFRLGCSILKEGRCVSASWTTTIIWDLAVFKPNQRKCLKFNQRFMHDVRGGLQAKFISSFYSHCLSHNCPYTGEYRLPHGVVAHLCSLITSFFFY